MKTAGMIAMCYDKSYNFVTESLMLFWYCYTRPLPISGLIRVSSSRCFGLLGGSSSWIVATMTSSWLCFLVNILFNLFQPLPLCLCVTTFLVYLGCIVLASTWVLLPQGFVSRKQQMFSFPPSFHSETQKLQIFINAL